MLLGASGPAPRVVDMPAHDGIAAHRLRLLLWPASGPQPHRLLIYEPGWDGAATENTRLAAMLAARGFDVAAVDYNTSQPPGFAADATRMEIPLDFSSDAALRRTTEQGDWRAMLRAADATALLDQLPDAATGAGIFGWSFGGAVALEACRQDARFKACLNMDGWMFGPAAEHPGPQPFMILSGDAYPATAQTPHSPLDAMNERDAARLRARLATRGGFYGQIAGLRHEDFRDAAAVPAIPALLSAFFDTVLRGDTAPMLDQAQKLPGVTLRRFAGPAR